MEYYSGQVLALLLREGFFGRTLESALGFVTENENEDTKIVPTSAGIE